MIKKCFCAARGRMLQGYYFSILLSLLLAVCSYEAKSTADRCDYNQERKKNKCIDICYSRKVCGDKTTCSTVGFTTYCSCKRGFTGDPLGGCFKMNKTSPCLPDPCGPNSECIESDPEIGPHCRCKKGFYDWPPNCRSGCKTDDECGPTEICNRSNSCEELCDEDRCGKNSVCRVDKKKLTFHCSCKDGYIPQTKKGCTLKTDSDDDIPVNFFAEILNDKCDGECGYNAYCGSNDTCVCTTDYEGDPHKECVLIQLERYGPCNPNPCGGLSECTIVNNEVECLCKEGIGTPPYCSKCNRKLDCSRGQTCVEGGRCVEDVCQPFCGDGVSCNIFDGKLECMCKIQAVNNFSFPFMNCPDIGFISAAAIAVLSG